MGSDKPSSGLWALFVVTVAAAIAVPVIMDLPQLMIRNFDLVQRSHLMEQTQRLTQKLGKLDAKIDAAKEEIRTVKSQTASLDASARNLDQRLLSLTALVAPSGLQFARSDRTSHGNIARLSFETTREAVAVVTAYAEGNAGDDKKPTLGLVLTVNGQPCASDRSVPRKREKGDLSVSAACVAQLSAGRENTIAAVRTEESIRGQVYLQYIAFNANEAAIARSSGLGNGSYTAAQSSP